MALLKTLNLGSAWGSICTKTTIQGSGEQAMWVGREPEPRLAGKAEVASQVSRSRAYVQAPSGWKAAPQVCESPAGVCWVLG